MKKIAFVGAQGTGKTSIMHAVGAKLREGGLRVECVDESGRSCPFELDQKTDFTAQFYIITTQVNNENISALKKPDVILTDRCVLDSLVYWGILRDKKRKTSADAAESRRLKCEDELMERVFDRWIPHIDLVVHVKTDDEVWKKRDVDDGLRDTDFEWYKKIQNGFEKMIEHKKIAAVELDNSGPFGKSVEKAVALIKNALSDGNAI